MPLIAHGYGRSYCLQSGILALSIANILRTPRGGIYGPVAEDANDLRDRFALRRDAELLLVSVAHDHFLERFWERHIVDRVPERLAQLGLLGMTIPNFSFFLDAPRTHTLWNRGRMNRVAEALSEAGIAVVPHLNALVPEDWRAWAEFLKEHSDVRVVAKEFQTGLARPERGIDAVRDLGRLQDSVGREIHVIAVGGGRYAGNLRKLFPDRFTVVDSVPFMKTVNRQKAVPRGQSVEWKHEDIDEERLGELLEDNIKRREQQIRCARPLRLNRERPARARRSRRAGARRERVA